MKNTRVSFFGEDVDRKFVVFSGHWCRCIGAVSRLARVGKIDVELARLISGIWFLPHALISCYRRGDGTQAVRTFSRLALLPDRP